MSGAPPPGWYPDPWRTATARWWDGEQWTSHVKEAGGASSAAPATGNTTSKRTNRGLLGGVPGVDARSAVEREATVARWVRWAVLVPPLLALVSLSAMARTVRAALEAGDSPDGIAGPGADGTQLTGLLALAATVGQMVWTYWAVSSSRLLGLAGRRAPGLACAGWLIPVVNYWWPYQDVRNLFPETQRPTRQLRWWWTLHVLTVPLLAVAVIGMATAGGGLLLWAPLAVLPPVGAAVLFRELIDHVLVAHRYRLAGPSAAPPAGLPAIR